MDSAHVISPRIRIDGTLQGSGSLDVQGEVHGDLSSQGPSTLAVKAPLRARSKPMRS